VFLRLSCGHPLLLGLMAHAAKSLCGSLFIGILASFPIQCSCHLLRKNRMSGTFALCRICAFVILCSSTSNMLMLSILQRLWWWKTCSCLFFSSVRDHASHPQRMVLSGVVRYMHMHLCCEVNVGVSEEASEDSHLCGGFLDTCLYVGVITQIRGEDGAQVEEGVGEGDVSIGNIETFLGVHMSCHFLLPQWAWCHWHPFLASWEGSVENTWL